MSDRNWDDTLLAITYWIAITTAIAAVLVTLVVLLARFFP